MKNLAKNRSELLPILLLLAACLVIGIITVKDYGESWDERDIYSYGDYALKAYQYFWQPERLPELGTNLVFYGPAYFMALTLLARAVAAVHPAWAGPIAWHFGYFLTFLICVLLLYLLSMRWLGRWASLGTCLLFVSQPLFWGHAFINPKDLPFTTFFLGSVVLGFEMVDRYFSPRPNYLLVAIAGIVLGLTVSFRAVGPLAGLFVALYAVSKSPRGSIRLLIPYLLLAAIVTYLTWPFLWGAPVLKFMKSLKMMSNFPFDKNVLFMGQLYEADQLPWFYYPVMLGIQFTEPILPLALIGLGLAVRNFILHREVARGPLLLFIGWFLLPALAIVTSGSTLYDNARQLFFLLPPVFLLIGLSLDTLINWLRSPWLIAAAIFLCMLPGVYVSIRLHPYEYVYYNWLVRGTGGAYRQYEMDYWATSFEEATNYVNAVAPQNAKVVVFGPEFVVQHYARPDLQIHIIDENTAGLQFDYAILLTRKNLDERRCRAAATVFSVGRRGAVFSIVRQVAPGEQCR
jgi:hypothetical protein